MPDFEKINLPGGKNKPEDNERDLLKKQQEIYDRLRAKNEEEKEGDILSFGDAEKLENFQKNKEGKEPEFWQDEEEAKMAAIANVAKLGESGEKTLFKIFKKNLKADQIFQRKELQRVKSSHGGKLNPEDYEDSDYEYDERGVIDDFELKSRDNPNYVYNDFILKQLKEIAGPKTVDFAVEILAENQDAFSLYYHGLRDLLANPNQKDYAAEKLLERLQNDKPQEQNFRLIITFTDLLSAETAREKINEAITKEKDQNVINNPEYARAFFTPNHDKIAMKSVEELYKKINFKEYRLNQAMNEEEVELLKSLTKDIKDNGRVLDMGCGVGRLLLAMKQADYDITGYDLTEDHLKEIKKDDGTAKVLRGDWHQNGLKDQSFDAIYSLGRNILHDYSLPDQIQLFREAARILKPGGQFIFDIPDRDKGGFKEKIDIYSQAMDAQKKRELTAEAGRHAAGGYRQAVEDYEREMKRRGIRNFRQGAIYDSPDGTNFMTRYVYSQEDIEQLAKLAGFKIVEIKQKELPTGKGDVNLYFVLEKV